MFADLLLERELMTQFLDVLLLGEIQQEGILFADGIAQLAGEEHDEKHQVKNHGDIESCPVLAFHIGLKTRRLDASGL